MASVVQDAHSRIRALDDMPSAYWSSLDRISKLGSEGHMDLVMMDERCFAGAAGLPKSVACSIRAKGVEGVQQSRLGGRCISHG